MFIDYNPKKHKTEQLFEVQSTIGEDGSSISMIVKSDVDRATAEKTPWYYMVEIEDGEDANQ